VSFPVHLLEWFVGVMLSQVVTRDFLLFPLLVLFDLSNPLFALLDLNTSF
jgi:hypothetical protein